MKIIVIFFISLLRSTSLHLYAAAEQTYLVSQSPSLKNIYACKDKCFALNQTFPFPMKYVRTVWAQLGTNHMYLEGHCYLDLSSSSPDRKVWTLWSALNQTQVLRTPQQKEAWSKFNRNCENKQTEMSGEIREILGLTYIHSEYVFYSDGKFENTQEGKQKDINDMLGILLNDS